MDQDNVGTKIVLKARHKKGSYSFFHLRRKSETKEDVKEEEKLREAYRKRELAFRNRIKMSKGGANDKQGWDVNT